MKFASILWRLALTALLATLTWQVARLRYAPAWIEAQIRREGNQTRNAVLAAIADTRCDLMKQITSLRADLVSQTTGIRADLMSRTDRLIDLSDRDLQDIAGRVDRQLTAANASVAEAASIAKIRDDIAPLLPPIKNSLEVASENADLLGRCAVQDPATGEWIGNQDCLANRLIPALKNMEHMAAAIQKETPETATAVRKTSQDLAVIVNRFAQPTSWIKGVLMTATRVAGKWFGF